MFDPKSLENSATDLTTTRITIKLDKKALSAKSILPKKVRQSEQEIIPIEEQQKEPMFKIY